MKTVHGYSPSLRRFAALMLCAFLCAVSLMPYLAHAHTENRTVRVGWYESPFNTMDETGRRSGYAYEYQQKIAAYTGWNYEYVEGSWPDLLQMLMDGEIDLMSDVSYTSERAEKMLFSNLPMGAEEYYLFVDKDNEEIIPNDYSTLNGKVIGANKGSVQIGYYHQWAEQHGVQATVLELNTSVENSLQMLKDGEIDAYLAPDSYGDSDTEIPISLVGSSDFYFAVNQNRKDLLDQLNTAMSMIRDEDKFYNQEMYEKYSRTSTAHLGLSAWETAWLQQHGAIRVGYQDNYLAFCAADSNGELTGALKDYLAMAEESLGNDHLNFEAVSFPTATEAMEALKQGDVDCVFPSNLTAYEGERLGVTLSRPLMRTETLAVVRQADQQSFFSKEHVTAALNRNNLNYEVFMAEHFPQWNTVTFQDTPTCLDAVADGKADCVIISNYRYNNIAKQCEKLHLTTVSTGVYLDYGLAIHKGDTELYSILTRVIKLVPTASINAALNYYSSEEVDTTLSGFIHDNPYIVSSVLVMVLALVTIVIIQHRLIIARKKVDESQHMVEDLNKQVYVDALTHVRNKGGYDNYMQQLQSRLDQGEALEFAVGVIDCNNLKQINDQNGHDKGNEYLLNSSRLICRVFQHSPVFRIGGDEFVAVLLGEDYENRDLLARRFEEEQAEINASKRNQWEKVSVASGIAVFDPAIDQSLKDLLGRADQLMYENKRLRKEALRH